MRGCQGGPAPGSIIPTSDAALAKEEILAQSGSYARGGQARSVPDPLAGPYAGMVAQQRAYNSVQEAELERRRSNSGNVIVADAADFAGPVSSWTGRMYQPSADDVAELRRQQAEFKKTERAISRENAWMAVPALAPAAAVLGLEAAGAIVTRLAPAAVKRAPLQFLERDPYLRVGDNWATRAGRRAHAALREAVEKKPGWESEPGVPMSNGRIVRPDVRTPPRVRAQGQPPKPYQMELKPDTPSGRRAAERALKKYEGTGVKTRAIFYDPKPFI